MYEVYRSNPFGMMLLALHLITNVKIFATFIPVLSSFLKDMPCP
jgi:hypothetical protein